MHALIDIHTHHPWFPPQSDRATLEASARQLLDPMDRAGVAISALLGRVAPGQDACSVREGNASTLAMVDYAPDRFFGMVFVNPALPAAAVAEELDLFLPMPQFRAIKLELDINCRDPRLDLVMEKAREYGVPVLHHSWYVNVWSMKGEDFERQRHRSEPHDVVDLARRFPDVPIIMAHMEGSGIRGILDVADQPNIVVDTSGSQPFSGTLEFALQTLGSERLFFGSDMTGRGMESQLGRIYGTPMSQQERDNLLFGNARQLFSL